VAAITSTAKQEAVARLGPASVLTREADLLAELGPESVDVVIDNVGGGAFGTLFELLRRRGRYVSSGAIAGPLFTLDLRSFYLKDLTLIGSTSWDAPVFPNLIRYIEAGEIRPLVARAYPL
jgi:NADPH:quinone reductase-like Zn-dependent oxidoreductase